MASYFLGHIANPFKSFGGWFTGKSQPAIQERTSPQSDDETAENPPPGNLTESKNAKGGKRRRSLSISATSDEHRAAPDSSQRPSKSPRLGTVEAADLHAEPARLDPSTRLFLSGQSFAVVIPPKVIDHGYLTVTEPDGDDRMIDHVVSRDEHEPTSQKAGSKSRDPALSEHTDASDEPHESHLNDNSFHHRLTQFTNRASKKQIVTPQKIPRVARQYRSLQTEAAKREFMKQFVMSHGLRCAIYAEKMATTTNAELVKAFEWTPVDRSRVYPFAFQLDDGRPFADYKHLNKLRDANLLKRARTRHGTWSVPSTEAGDDIEMAVDDTGADSPDATILNTTPYQAPATSIENEQSLGFQKEAIAKVKATLLTTEVDDFYSQVHGNTLSSALKPLQDSYAPYEALQPEVASFRPAQPVPELKSSPLRTKTFAQFNAEFAAEFGDGFDPAFDPALDFVINDVAGNAPDDTAADNVADRVREGVHESVHHYVASDVAENAVIDLEDYWELEDDVDDKMELSVKGEIAESVLGDNPDEEFDSETEDMVVLNSHQHSPSIPPSDMSLVNVQSQTDHTREGPRRLPETSTGTPQQSCSKTRLPTQQTIQFDSNPFHLDSYEQPSYEARGKFVLGDSDSGKQRNAKKRKPTQPSGQYAESRNRHNKEERQNASIGSMQRHHKRTEKDRQRQAKRNRIKKLKHNARLGSVEL